MSARVTASNILEIEEFLSAQPAATRTAARIAINSVTARQAVPQYRREMRKEVNFPQGYLEDGNRFGQTKKATDADLSATVTARFRPTSLARFAKNTSLEGAKRRGGVSVQVDSGGGAVFLRRAFFVKLRRGGDTSDGFNLGVAIRLKPGEKLLGRKKGATGVRLADNLYLLYGPSVDQVFRSVSVSESGFVSTALEKEFLRQYIRLAGS